MAEKTTPKENTVYTTSPVVSVKLQLAGYAVMGARFITVHKKEYELKGSVPLEVEILNENVKTSARNTGDALKAKRMTDKYSFTQDDIDIAIYRKPQDPDANVVQIKEKNKEVQEKLKERRKKKTQIPSTR